MAKNKKSAESPISSIVNNLGKGFLDGVERYIMSALKEKIHKIWKEITKTALSVLLVVSGVFFLFVSLIFFLHMYIGLDYAQIFFSVGIVSLTIGVIVKYIKY